MFVLLLLLVPGFIFAATCISSSMFVGRCVNLVSVAQIPTELPKIKMLEVGGVNPLEDIVANCDAFRFVAYAYQRA